MTISIIVAASENNVIGKDNDLPWKLPTDMKFFMNTTKHHHVIMGRKNYLSIPEKYKPLPERTNIVVTRQKDFTAPECIIVHSIEEGLEIARKRGEDEAFIIGGGEIYRQSMSLVDKIYLTRVHKEFDGDTFFPEVDEDQWLLTHSKLHKADEKNPYDFTFLTYVRRKN